MKALLLTVSAPPAPGRDEQGGIRRLALFVGALATLAPRIDIAHLVPASVLAEAGDAAAFDRAQSAYWGHPVAVTLIANQVRRETFRNHYVAGVFDAAEQPWVFPFAGAAQAEAVGRLLDGRPDIVVVNGLAAMCAVLRSGRRPARMVFDQLDLDHLVRLRWCLHPPVWPGKLGYLAHLPALIAATRRGAARSRCICVCSEPDRRHLRRLGVRRAVVVPNAVALPAAPPPPATAPVLLFLGSGGHAPNIAAAERLATRIMPMVRAAVPEARLLIAGKGSEALPSRAAAPPAVEYLGFVADLAALYAGTRVVCCPIAQGGGTRVKLVEAAGFARAMVATRIGAEGLDFVDERDILLRDSDAAFAAACVRLLRDPDACRRLGAAARATALRLYDADRVREAIAAMLRQA